VGEPKKGERMRVEMVSSGRGSSGQRRRSRAAETGAVSARGWPRENSWRGADAKGKY